MSIPSLSDTMRLYIRFVQAKGLADHYENYEVHSYALNVVMDYIHDHLDDPVIQGLAAALGEWEVGTDED